MPQTPRVFISYARKDGEAFAVDLVRRIEEADIPVWCDRDGLRGGEGWWSQIDYVLDQVEFVVVVMTPGAVASKVVGKEWDAARRKGLCIFPVMVSSPGNHPLKRRLSRFFFLLFRVQTDFLSLCNVEKAARLAKLLNVNYFSMLPHVRMLPKRSCRHRG